MFDRRTPDGERKSNTPPGYDGRPGDTAAPVPLAAHPETAMTQPDARLERLAVDTIRTLAIDGVQQANSGHPGAPMGMAAMAYTLWTKHLQHAPTHPDWPNRDRFVLSAGHASMLEYALLHLTGYAVSLEDVKSFRQWGSITPGHPEFGMTPGVEATTGPLGQGLSNAVGMAIAERRLAAEFNKPGHTVVDHHTFVICSDGDLQEGITAEASSLAGHLRLGKLIALYDDNQIQLDGPTALAFTEDVLGRYAAYGWHTQRVADGNDVAAINTAIEAAKVDPRPSIIAVRTHIGFGSPNKQDSQKSHGAPLGPDEVRLTKEAYGWDPDKTFFVPDEAREIFRAAVGEGEARVAEWNARMDGYATAFPDEAAELRRRISGRLPADWDATLPVWEAGSEVATRNASQDAIQALAATLSELFGGSADLSESNLTDVKANGHDHFEADNPGRNLRFGVREHAMGAIANGLAYHGGFLPYVATFLTFSDYMRGAVRIAALSGLHVTYVWTHDSVGLGEDGPTHQPVEHYAALRAIPNLWFVRPGDGNETAAAWALAAERPTIADPGPVALALTRQKLPTLPGTKEHAREGLRRGGYVIRDAAGGKTPDVILIGTGSELQLCAAAADALEADGIGARVVSLPCWERFEAQDQAYRDSVIPPSVRKRVTVEIGVTLGWDRWAGDEGAIIGLDHFGASAPAGTIFKEFGFTTDKVVDVARKVVREGFRGRVPAGIAPHGHHPSLAAGDSGTDRTPGSDPGHD
jgi:transketolase